MTPHFPINKLQTTDHQIITPDGELYLKLWAVTDAPSDAPVILLFHDSLGAVSLWREFPDSLASATGLTVIAYDRLGFGRSDPNPHRLTASFMRDEAEISVAAIIEQMGLKRFIAFGHSVGGEMAVATAACYPERCLAVITESSRSFVEDHTVKGIHQAIDKFADPAQVARLARYHGDKAQWVLDAWFKTWLAEDFADWTLDSLLAQVRCPLLTLHGDLDEFGSEAHPRRIVEKSGGPSATLKMLKDTGHVPHRERESLVLEIVVEFLQAAGIISVR